MSNPTLIFVQGLQAINQLIIELQKIGITLGDPDLTDEQIKEKIASNISEMEELRDND